MPMITRLEAVDGSVDVANAQKLLLCTSKLLHSFPAAQRLQVPFTKNEIEGWRDYVMGSNRSFSNCVAALKVRCLPDTVSIVVTMVCADFSS